MKMMLITTSAMPIIINIIMNIITMVIILTRASSPGLPRRRDLVSAFSYSGIEPQVETDRPYLPPVDQPYQPHISIHMILGPPIATHLSTHMVLGPTIPNHISIHTVLGPTIPKTPIN